MKTIEDFESYFEDANFKTVGMTKTQMDNFIFGMQITSNRTALQFLNELYARYSSRKGHELDIEELEADKLILEEGLVESNSVGKNALINVKIKKKIHELRMTNAKLKQTIKEIEYILSTLNQYEEYIGMRIEEVDFENEAEERIYWTKRLAKQSGLDLAASGRISTGTLESLMALPEGERTTALATALSISHAIKHEMVTSEQLLIDNKTETEMIESKNNIMASKLTIGAK